MTKYSHQTSRNHSDACRCCRVVCQVDAVEMYGSVHSLYYRATSLGHRAHAVIGSVCRSWRRTPLLLLGLKVLGPTPLACTSTSDDISSFFSPCPRHTPISA